MYETLEESVLSGNDLYWQTCIYSKERLGYEPSTRTFQRWKKVLQITPDKKTGLFHIDDLKDLKFLVRGLLKGQNYQQIKNELEEIYNAKSKTK